MTEEQESVSAPMGVEPLGTVAVSHGCHANDDTVELALTEEEMLALSRAAEEGHAKTTLRNSALIAAGAFLRNLSARARTYRWPLGLASSVLGIATGVVLGVVLADRIFTVTISAPASAPHSAESLESPVRFGNPFDASEVFEFPPGTSVDQARQSVAAALVQRARDRQAAGIVKSGRPMPVATADHTRVVRNSEPPAASSWR